MAKKRFSKIETSLRKDLTFFFDVKNHFSKKGLHLDLPQFFQVNMSFSPQDRAEVGQKSGDSEKKNRETPQNLGVSRPNRETYQH